MAAAVILSLLVARAAVPVKLIVDTDIGGGGCRDVVRPPSPSLEGGKRDVNMVAL